MKNILGGRLKEWIRRVKKLFVNLIKEKLNSVLDVGVRVLKKFRLTEEIKTVNVSNVGPSGIMKIQRIPVASLGYNIT